METQSRDVAAVSVAPGSHFFCVWAVVATTGSWRAPPGHQVCRAYRHCFLQGSFASGFVRGKRRLIPHHETALLRGAICD
jgi:hypothetical protein